MCNAWNHPPGCMCGWGGEGHLGRGGGGLGHDGGYTSCRPPRIIVRRASQTRKAFNTVDSFLNPNAHCPVCGAPVFYYQSPDGGKVYFDALGPPWPKHPCTDNGYSPSSSTGSAGIVVAWRDKGWQPFFVKGIEEADDQTVKFVGFTVKEDDELILYVNKASVLAGITRQNLFQVRSLGDGSFLISTFFITGSPKIEVKEHVFTGYSDKNRLKHPLEAPLKKKEAGLSAMELAFKKAVEK